MEKLIYESIFRALNRHKVRYLVLGGVAVILHGWTRFTKDLDLMIDYEDPGNVSGFTRAMKDIDFHPHVPVNLSDLGDARVRETWIKEKNAVVFQLGHLSNPLERIDIMLANPLDFKAAYRRRKTVSVRGIEIPIISLDDLIELKEKVARPQDMEDAKCLKNIRYRNEKE